MLSAALLASVVVAGMVHSIPATAHGGALVDIHSYRFDPSPVTVEAGDTVTWTNHDRAAHDVTFTSGYITSGPLTTDETFSYTFSEPGTVKYLCEVHPDMQGTVTVVPSEAPSTTAAPVAAVPDQIVSSSTTTAPLAPAPSLPVTTPRRAQLALDPRFVLAAALAGVIVYCALLLGRAGASP